MTTGRVFLVGAGPGDPDLLTIKALRLIENAEVIVFDRLVSDDIMALAPRGATRIYAGKALDKHDMPQDEINELIVNLARSGHAVVRLKGGDPFIFGRGGEEAEELAKAGIPFEVVPGITSAQGCGTYAGIPLTHRGLATGVRYVTGHFRENKDLAHDWRSLTDPMTTLAIYMGLANFERIATELIAAGRDRDTPAAAVHRGTTRQQKTVFGTLGTLAEAVKAARIEAPVMFIVGEVVSMASSLAWFEPSEAAANVAHSADRQG